MREGSNVAKAQHTRRLRAPASQSHVNARQPFLELEGFGQIVVGAALEA